MYLSIQSSQLHALYARSFKLNKLYYTDPPPTSPFSQGWGETTRVQVYWYYPSSKYILLVGEFEESKSRIYLQAHEYIMQEKYIKTVSKLNTSFSTPPPPQLLKKEGLAPWGLNCQIFWKERRVQWFTRKCFLLLSLVQECKFCF